MSVIASHSCLDQVLRPEIRPQVHNLPRPKSNQHPHRPESKPLNPLIRALVCISELLLSHPQVLHLSNNLLDILLDPPQLSINRLKLLRSLDCRPISCIGADVDIELDVARGGV